MITVQHPTAGTVQFPDGTSEAEMAQAMAQLDQPQAPASPKEQFAQRFAEATGGMRPTRPIGEQVQAVRDGGMGMQDMAAIKSMGLVGGGSAMGQAIGSRMGPVAPVAASALGAIGAGAGSIIDQMTDATEGISWGRVGADTLAGLIPGGKIANASPKQLAVEGIKQGAGNVAASQLESSIEGKGVLSIPAAAASFASAQMGTAMSKGMGGGMDAPKDWGVRKGDIEAIRAMRKLGVKDGTGKVIRSVVVDPASLHDNTSPSMKSFAGTRAMGQEASIISADALHAAGREAIGLSATADPIKPQVIEARIKKLYEPYKKIQAIADQAKKQLADLDKQALTGSGHELAVQKNSPEYRRMAEKLRIQAGADIVGLQETRKAIKQGMEAVNNGNAEAYAQVQDLRAKERALEAGILKAGRASGDKELFNRLVENRRAIARSHVLLDSVSLNGVLDPRKVRNAKRAGAQLDGNLDKIAKFTDAVERDTMPVNKVGDPNANQLDTHAGAYGMSVAPENAPGIIATMVGLPKARAKVRSYFISPEFQDKLIDGITPGQERFMAAMARQAAMQAGRQQMPMGPIE